VLYEYKRLVRRVRSGATMTTAKYMTILLATSGMIAAFPYFAEGQNGPRTNHDPKELPLPQAASQSDPDRNSTAERHRTEIFRVSGYCPCTVCCDEWGRIPVESGQRRTASGHIIRPGDKFVAAPSKYPYGTAFEIPGYGSARKRDCGGAIKAAGEVYRGKTLTMDRLDCYFDRHSEAVAWGIQILEVKVIQ
jgi:3D (Asp-Asp-Asp) domain-containing protein